MPVLRCHVVVELHKPGTRLAQRSLIAATVCLLVGGCSEPRRGAQAALLGAAASSPPTDLVYSRVIAEGKRALCIAPAEGGPERRLTDGAADDGLPRWTPDGRAVIFSSKRSGTWQLWQVPAEGGRPTRLRANSCDESQADLSPDGKTLAFLSDCDGPQSLWCMNLADATSRLLARHRRRTVLGNPHWNRDGRRIVFSSNRDFGHQIYVVDSVSGDERRLSGLLSGGCEPRFSPDGSKVVHVTRGHRGSTSQLIETDLASGAQKTLVDWPALNYDPVYSADGAELAFASNMTGEYQIYRLRLSDGKPYRVTSRPGEAREPDYRPLR
jgi:Tol biopolymer transport system component